FFSSRRRHTRSKRDWSSDVCSSDLAGVSRPEVVGELVERLQTMLDRKGMRSLGGSFGTQSVLVIHTDEFHLNADNVAATLKNTVFKKPSTIQRAFLLLSYDPNRGGYRSVDLRLAA